MNLIRAATLSVANLDRSIDLYSEWLDYQVVETGSLDDDLAASWGCPATAGNRLAILQPSSGLDLFIRLVENPSHPDYQPLVSCGWSAIEICVQDVLKVNERMLRSPFEIIGPPRAIAGLDAIFPMQVKGPDGEIVYLTEIRADLPEFKLPRAESLIDRLFILVMGCSDMAASLAWMEKHVGLEVGRRKMELVYTMLSKAYGLPEDELHTISTMVHERDVFLELDQLPGVADRRPGFAGALPQGIAIGTLWHPDFDALDTRCKDLWISQPKVRDSNVYGGKRAATLRAPDGTLVEIAAA